MISDVNIETFAVPQHGTWLNLTYKLLKLFDTQLACRQQFFMRR